MDWRIASRSDRPPIWAASRLAAPTALRQLAAVTSFSERDRLKGLIDYVEATERDRLSVVWDVADHRGFRRFRADAIRLPGVHLDVQEGDDHRWMVVDRLVRCPPPLIDDADLRAWTDLGSDPGKLPVLKSEIAATDAEQGETPSSVRLADHPRRDDLATALDAYLRERWTPWAQEERPRRQSIELYNALFALRQQIEGGGEQPIELVWGIGVARWTQAVGSLRYPLLTTAVELALDEASHAIIVRPRIEVPPGIETDALDLLQVDGLNAFRAAADAHFAALEGGGLSPFDEASFAAVLRRAVALLHADACYLPDLGDRRPPDADTLTVDDGWVLFERPRRSTGLMEDLRRFRASVDALEDADAIPAAVRVLLQSPDTAVASESYPAMRGVSTIPGVTSADGSGDDLFFPKPFNREQVEVIQRLSARPGVVVQGPPGTGKTHTIANIVSHYLAMGKRVLVTSQKAPALKVLRDKLPAAVRPLAVSLLESDRDGLKQFQESVDIIADRLQRTRLGEARERIAILDREVDNLHRALARVDSEVDAIGRRAMTPATIDGVPVEPVEAARRVVAAGEAGRWFADPLGEGAAHEPGFDEEAVARLRAARKEVGGRLEAIGLAPPPADLPSSGELLSLHDTLLEAETLRREIAAQADVAHGTDVAAIAALEERLDHLAAQRAAIGEAGMGWSDALLGRLRSDPDDAAAGALAGLAGEVDRALGETRHFLTLPVVLAPEALADQGFREALAGLARGEEMGLFQSIFARGTKARLAEVRIAGRAPGDGAAWAEVDRYAGAIDDAVRLGAVWNHAAAHAGLDPVAATGLAGADAMRRQLAQLDRVRGMVEAEDAVDAEVRRLLPGWRGGVAAGTDALRRLLGQHRRRLGLEAARTSLRELQDRVAGIAGPVGQALRSVTGLIGEETADCEAIDRRWSAALDEATALRRLQPAFATIREVADAIEGSGAGQWAARLRSEAVEGVEDPITPGDWRARWTLRRLSTWLDRIDAHGRLRALSAERGELEERLRRAYEDAIETRTWCRLAEQATDQVRSALAAYAQAMRKIGRGTGIRAGRYRADARAAADRAKNALPCWIMPHYRVSESLPAELGLFDLVIVDEASQSTVAALPALLRARQMLIVGDDRQVSPDAGFRQEARLSMLAERHLGGQVADYRATMREDRSLYDLGTVVFAGGAIMLKEHFRCVAPVIEYSKAQFYSHQLVPLRLPSASERLDPPLVDILVEDGYRQGKVNPPEVDCIVDEIGRIAADPTMHDRSIGVTTLLGQEQAQAIMAAIEQVLGAEIMIRHDIRVGEPAAFQGDERDIMFVSLVADRDSGALSGLGYEQRFNVAASRARDRMVLVRSVEADDLRPADKLRRSLLEHFQAPFAAESALVEDRRARCESGFERAMFDRLIERGYRVDTQVRVGTKRIDLVVEGADDRRLAIECDGDAFHGPDRWPDDMARQRMLERAGWSVWRCFASRFVREEEAVMAELVGVLQGHGIVPELGRDQSRTRHTETRRWRSAPIEPSEPVPFAWLMPVEAF